MQPCKSDKLKWLFHADIILLFTHEHAVTCQVPGGISENVLPPCFVQSDSHTLSHLKIVCFKRLTTWSSASVSISKHRNSRCQSLIEGIIVSPNLAPPKWPISLVGKECGNSTYSCYCFLKCCLFLSNDRLLSFNSAISVFNLLYLFVLELLFSSKPHLQNSWVNY